MGQFRSLGLALEFYQKVSAQAWPLHLRDQILRAASSIALNLSEGNAKPTERDRRKFFYIALGSCRECQTILKLCSSSDPELLSLADRLGAHLYGLTRAKL